MKHHAISISSLGSNMNPVHDEDKLYHTAAIQLWSFDVYLSDCPSVKRINSDKMKNTSAHILRSYERPIDLVLQYEEWLAGNVPATVTFKPNYLPS